MARYAIHEGGLVTNVIDADPLWIEAHYPTADRVFDGTFVGPGFTRVSAGVYTPPVVDDPPDPEPEASIRRWVTKLAFRQRFTAAERAAITYAARQSSPTAAGIQSYLDDVQAATYIDLERADTRAGVQALESAGLLASGRAAEILDATITFTEEYRG